MSDRRRRHEDFIKERRERYDRREHDRVEVVIPMELTAGNDLYFHVSGNLSVGGAFFDRVIPHPVGTPVEISFSLPGEEGPPIRCRAEVVNIPEDNEGLGMGVRFLDLTDESRNRLESFFEDLDSEE